MQQQIAAPQPQIAGYKPDKKDFYIRTGLLGVFRGFCGLPFEHPFDVLKTRLQASESVRQKYKNSIEIKEFTSRSMVKNWYQIYKQFGFFNGVYAGYIPNLARVCAKQFYRFPMMIYFPAQFQKHIPEQYLQKYDGLHKISAGLVIAALESVIICPLERLKVTMMTKQQQQTKYLNSIKKSNNSLFKSLYQGLDALLYRQITSWVSFLYLDYKVKKEFKEYRGIQMNEALSSTDLVCASVIIGVVNVLIVQPLDKIKTLCQMQGSKAFASQGFMQNLSQQYRTKGIQGFYSGLKPRMTHYIINALFTCQILEKLELAVVNKNIGN